MIDLHMVLAHIVLLNILEIQILLHMQKVNVNEYEILYSFLNMSHLLKQCINFTNQILNINYHKSLVSRYNLTSNKNISCLNCNKKKKWQIPLDI